MGTLGIEPSSSWLGVPLHEQDIRLALNDTLKKRGDPLVYMIWQPLLDPLPGGGGGLLIGGRLALKACS